VFFCVLSLSTLTSAQGFPKWNFSAPSISDYLHELQPKTNFSEYLQSWKPNTNLSQFINDLQPKTNLSEYFPHLQPNMTFSGYLSNLQQNKKLAEYLHELQPNMNLSEYLHNFQPHMNISEALAKFQPNVNFSDALYNLQPHLNFSEAIQLLQPSVNITAIRNLLPNFNISEAMKKFQPSQEFTDAIKKFSPTGNWSEALTKLQPSGNVSESIRKLLDLTKGSGKPLQLLPTIPKINFSFGGRCQNNSCGPVNPNKYNLQSERIDPDDTCFELLGCFSNKSPWVSAIRPAFPPNEPENIITDSILYTRKISNKTLSVYPNITSEWKKYINPKHNFTIIIHGYKDRGQAPWLAKIARGILKRQEQNVILVDWSKGSFYVGTRFFIDYAQAVGNSRACSAVLTRFLWYLKDHCGAKLNQFHLIGHSLGAHIAGYIGKAFHGKLRWITGLDPANPLFTGMPNEVRMAPNDAKFTDVVHSDVGAAGEIATSGKCDFYLNVGFIQPECIFPESKDAKDPINCSHEASYNNYITATTTPNCFIGRPVSLKGIAEAVANTLTLGNLFTKFNETSCEKDSAKCVPMGLETIKHVGLCRNDKIGGRTYDKPGTYVLYTSSISPYCLF